MDQLITVLDFLSRAIALLLAAGALLGFALRKWVGAWIDARFKRQLDQELRGVEHKFAVPLEDKKNALAKDLNDYTEHLRIKLASQFEREKHNIDEEFKTRARILDERSKFAEPLARAAYDLQ